MKMRYKNIFWAPLLLSIISCTQPFEIESFDFERVIVVDGLVTDEDKNHHVLLSYTRPIGETEIDPLSNATVWVQEVGGVKMAYSEQSAGIYHSDLSFAGAPGKQYQLHFVTSNGEEYASIPVSLTKSPPIDSIYDQYATVSVEDDANQNSGIQFFLDTHDDQGQAKYFRYEWQEDYKILSPYPSQYIYNDEDSTYKRRESQVHICYSGSNSKQVLIGSSIGSTVNRLVQFPVVFVSGKLDKLRQRYALLVKQYAISESAYGFYRKLKESNESGGSLFDKQQGTITGNVTSVDDPTVTVLGFFDVAGVSTKRTFFNNNELDPRLGIPPYRYQCGPNSIVRTGTDSISYYAGTQGYQIINIVPFGMPPVSLGTISCTTCDWFATTVKPDFWID